jgi:biopolymer transport protein ExbB/TolQ
MLTGISTFFSKGGFWMWPILFMSIAALAVIVERFIFLYMRHNVDAGALMRKISEHVQTGQINQALTVCSSAQESAIARVLAAGLRNASQGPDKIQNALEEQTLAVTPEITARGTLLQNIANIATLLGLLGTILGLIESFQALATIEDPEAQSKALVNGISVAMNTTAFGLMVAIPCLLSHVFLSSTTKKILDEIEYSSVKLENLLITRLQGERR